MGKLSLDLISDMVEQAGDIEVNGVLAVYWQADGTVSARYCGEQLSPLQCITLASNGIQALAAGAQAAESGQGSPLTIVPDEGE